MKFMFLPYILYLLIINYNSGFLMGDYFEMIAKQSEVGYKHTTEDDKHR